ncbi:PAS domain S-box protein [Methanoregula sp. PtaB.Bin085]|uniref:PAS domain S-box protein n=1 Tax=Methanoregula sp. PtaB.Bin085 TaxID=1811680 RepID=UPI0009CE28E2|nr:PAS domain S-box protein [Methanoregula sp. PtaB.Bin085]OPX64450.1 MAG: sensory histidine kinase AtoS [Methanoregula sp. PtaB.Bin085]
MMRPASLRDSRAWVPHAAVAGSTFAVLLLTIFSLMQGISTVFMHLYYLPLVLAGYYYRRRGIPLIIALSLAYLLLVAWFDWSSPIEIGAAALRAGMFTLIGSVVAYLSNRLFARSAEIETLVANMQDVVYRADSDGTLIMASPSWAALLGYPSVEDCLGKNLARDFYVNPADREAFLRALAQDGKVSGYIITLKKGDGQPVIVSTSSHYWYGPDGNIGGVEGVFRDVTRQQDLEKGLRESEARYREFFTTSRDCVFITTPEGRWIDFNDSALELFRYDRREDLFAVPIGSLYASSVDWENIVRQIVRDGYVRDFPVRLKRRDGILIDALITSVAVRDADGAVRHLTGTVRDITEHKRVVEALQESEEKFRQFFNNVNDAVYVHRIHSDGRPGRIIEANDVMCLRLGYSRDELLAMEMPDLVAGEGMGMIPDVATRIRRDGHATFETFHKTKDGSSIPVEVNTHLFVQKGERLALASARDISERRKAEAALRESEEKFRAIFDSINDAVHIHGIGKDGLPRQIISVNDAACIMLGYSPEELQKKNPLDLVTGYHNRPLEEIGNDLATKGQAVFETEHIRKDGAVIPVEINARVSMISEEKVVVSVVRDITQRKLTETALRKSEQRYRSLFENMQDGLAYCRMIFDDNGAPVDFVYLAINQAFDRIIGGGTVTGKPVTEVFPGIREAFPQLFVIYGRVARTGVPESFELYFSPAEKWLHISVYSPSRDHFVAVFSDITEKHRAEEALRASSRALRENQVQLENAMDLAHMANWEFDAGTGVFTFNPRFYALYGTTAEREGGMQMPAWVYAREFSHPDDAEMVARVIQKAVENPQTPAFNQIEHRIIRRDGEVRDIVVRLSVVTDEYGRVIGARGVNQDITERKKAEAALRESNQILEAVLNTIPARVFWKDTNLVYLGCNTAFARDAGYDKPEEILGKDDFAMAWRDQAELYRADDRTVIQTGRDKILYEEPQTTPSGQKIWLLTSKVSLRGPGGETMGILGTYLDITARKLSEEAVRDSSRRFSDIINFLPDPTFVIDRDGKIIAWNAAIQNLTGVPSGEILGKGNYEHAFLLFGERRPLLIDLVIHPDPDAIRQHYPKLQRDGNLLSGQFHVLSLRGKPSDLWIVATPLYNSAGEITGAIESIRDITEIKKTENALRDLNLTLEERVRERTQELENARIYTRSLIEASVDPLVLIGPDGTLRDVNSAAERMTGLSRDILIGTPFTNYILEKNQALEGLGSVMQTGSATGSRYTVINQDGSATPVIASAALFHDRGGSLAGVFIALHDITRILEDEEKISTQLREKEILLREVHHRVKNNLQIIVSLISLQTRAVQDPETAEALRDTQNRVRAIAIVHERLHLSGELGTIDFGGYLRYLGTSLFSFYQKNPADIHFVVAMENVILDIDTASPLGLVFNELISNMLKYAFPEGRKGECSIAARRDGRMLVLTMQDNGIGLPPDLDWRNSPTLGLRLVGLLVGQLKGTIDLDRTAGTKFTIAVTLPEQATGIHRVGGL